MKNPQPIIDEDIELLDLPRIADSLKPRLIPGIKVLLEGGLGVGKTTLVKALLESVSPGIEFRGSPTFPLHHRYLSNTTQAHHFDFYRLDEIDELFSRGLMEVILSSEGVQYLEWTSKIPGLKDQIIRRSDVLCIDLGWGKRETSRRICVTHVPRQPT